MSGGGALQAVQGHGWMEGPAGVCESSAQLHHLIFCWCFLTALLLPLLLPPTPSSPQVNTFGANNALTNLVPALQDVDPDEAFSSVPYEKGFALLYHLEELLGGPGETWTHLRPSE